jgi:cleavage stimulation factor subunit 3
VAQKDWQQRLTSGSRRLGFSSVLFPSFGAMSAVPEPTEHDPSAIVQTMQILTDIEEDLTDTAIAVAAAEVPSFIDTQTDLLQAAEAMESTLEQSIPAAPGQHEGEAQVETKDVRPEDLIRSEAGRTSAEPQRPEAAVTAAPAEELSSSTDDDASSIAHDASHAIGVVNSDNFIPVLPSEVVPPAHDVSLDTVVEKATRPTTVDAIPPSEENVAQAAANGEKPMDGITETVTPTVVETPSEISAIPPANGASNIIPPGPEGVDSSSVPLPTQTPFHPDPSAGEASLPDGLTDASPSVVSNRDIVRVWRGGMFSTDGVR